MNFFWARSFNARNVIASAARAALPGRDLIRDVIRVQRGTRFADVAQHRGRVAMDEVAEVWSGGAALAADAMTLRALKLRAKKKFMPVFPITVRFPRRAAVRAC